MQITRIYIVIVALMLWQADVYSQFVQSFVHTDQLAIGSHSSFYISPSSNPAFLGQYDLNSRVELSGQKSFFSQVSSIVGTFYFSGSLGGGAMISIGQRGVAHYHESLLQIAYGRPLSERWLVGISLGTDQLDLDEYGNTLGLHYKLGLIHNFGNTMLGVSWTEVYRAYGSPLRIYHLAALAKISDYLDVQAEIEYMADPVIGEIDFNIGLMYKPISLATCRIGLNKSSMIPSFGLDIVMGNTNIKIAHHHHRELGSVSSAGVAFRW